MPPPVGVPSPDGLPCRDCKYPDSFNFTRLGVRVPMLVISPWATASTAPLAPSGSAYEHSSLPATLRAAFPAAFPAPLTARDAWATPLNALWEGTPLAAPRTDTPLTLPQVPAGPSPALLGASRQGAGPLNHLQHALLVLAEAAAQAVEGRAWRPEAGQLELQSVLGTLQAAGALDSEASSGRYARARLGKFVQ